MRIAIIGAGPGGLYTAALVKRLRPACEIDVWEANAPDETFGFGVVFSEGALGGIEAADPRLFARLAAACEQWSRIDVHHRGRIVRNGGYRFSAIGRRVLLSMLRTRCTELGVTIRYGTPAPEAALLAGTYDLVVAADGVNSSTREAHREEFGTEGGERGSRYLWLGTDRTFTALTFAVADTEFGSMHAHAYPYAPGLSTFIAEVDDHVWEAAGFTGRGAGTPGGGRADADRIAGFFVDVLEGHRLRTNKSRWGASPSSATGAGATAPSPSSGTARTPRTSPSDRGPGWPWRTASPSPWRWTNTGRCPRHSSPTRRSAGRTRSPCSAPHGSARSGSGNWTGTRTSASRRSTPT